MEFTLVLAIFYVAINGFVLNVIEPRLVVTRLNLTPFMNVASATFWPLVLGPAGRDRRRAIDHGFPVVGAGRGPGHALAGGSDRQQVARPAANG